MARIEEINSQALTIALSRRLAMSDKRNQQQAIIQTASRLMDGATGTTKAALIDLISATPAEKQQIVDTVEKMFLVC
jgi:hypothetical protein